MKENILGFEVDTANAASCADEIMAALDRKDAVCRWLACLNPHSYALTINDSHFSAALRCADWLVADGVGVVLASCVLGGKIRERVTGSDIFSALNERMNKKSGFSVFFLGSTNDTLTRIQMKMATDYPNIRVAGTYSPPFQAAYSVAELDKMVAAINASHADVLWVGMTAPKQEKWIFDHRERLEVGFAAAVGAVFDFYTGNVKRSHPIFQKLGLEWLPRLVQQPRRLWRRMFVSAPVFVWAVLREKIERGRAD